VFLESPEIDGVAPWSTQAATIETPVNEKSAACVRDWVRRIRTMIDASTAIDGDAEAAVMLALQMLMPAENTGALRDDDRAFGRSLQ